MFCTNCGGPLIPTHRFCPNCATPAPAAAAPAQDPYSWSPIPVPGGVGAHPLPPDFHWGLVLLLNFVSSGMAVIFWGFYEALFVKKLDAGSKGVHWLAASLIANVFALVFIFVGAVLSSLIQGGNAPVRASFGTPEIVLLSVFGGMFAIFLVGFVLYEIGFFKMRRSLLAYYNTVEPIGLRLSAPMTFFFNVFYFQYHFSRIARWRQTGVLE